MGNEDLITNLETFKIRVTGMNIYAFNQNIEQFKSEIEEIADDEIRVSALNQLNEIGKCRIYFQDNSVGKIQINLVPKIQKLIDSL